MTSFRSCTVFTIQKQGWHHWQSLIRWEISAVVEIPDFDESAIALVRAKRLSRIENLSHGMMIHQKNPLRTGFEPAREYPIGFQVQRLNHSAIAADDSYRSQTPLKFKGHHQWRLVRDSDVMALTLIRPSRSDSRLSSSSLRRICSAEKPFLDNIPLKSRVNFFKSSLIFLVLLMLHVEEFAAGITWSVQLGVVKPITIDDQSIIWN